MIQGACILFESSDKHKDMKQVFEYCISQLSDWASVYHTVPCGVPYSDC